MLGRERISLHVAKFNQLNGLSLECEGFWVYPAESDVGKVLLINCIAWSGCDKVLIERDTAEDSKESSFIWFKASGFNDLLSDKVCDVVAVPEVRVSNVGKLCTLLDQAKVICSLIKFWGLK